jgi:hypothetical protein
MRSSVDRSAATTAGCVALVSMTIIGLAVPGSLTGGVSLACWAALLCGLTVRALFVLSPGHRGRLGERTGQLVLVPVVSASESGRGTRSIR